MTLINRIKNWWNPLGYEKRSIVISYEFKPKKNITAYEMFICKKMPHAYCYPSALEYQKALNKFYDDLPKKCKKYFEYKHETVIEYVKYGE